MIVEQESNEQRVPSLARQYGLTVYDAAYLELAQRENIPLVTLDIRLANAAQAEMVQLIDEAVG